MMPFFSNTKINRLIYLIIGLFSLLLIWTILSIVFSPFIIPYPHTVFLKMIGFLGQVKTYQDLLITVYRSLFGFLLAFFSGMAIGILSGSIRPVEKSLFLPIALLQGAPVILWIIPLMLILGTGGAAPVAIVFFVILPLVIINVQEGRKTITPLMFDMFKIYGNSKKIILKDLIISSLSPYIKSLLFLGIILSLKSSVIGEWFSAVNGIGRNINQYFYNFDMASLYAISIIFLVSIGIFAGIARYAGNFFLPARKITKIIPVKRSAPDGFFTGNNSRLILNNVVFSYGSRQILSIGDFSVSADDSAIITGNSGSGKTTLAKLATGILQPKSGEIILPKNPGFIFQEDALLNHLDCFGNAALPARWKKISDYEKTVCYFLELCGLEGSFNLFPDELSGGMKKRLAFARALILNPDFIILDEPFNNLHKEGRMALWDLFFNLFAKRKIPYLIITHYPEELENRNLKIYELKEGDLSRLQ